MESVLVLGATGFIGGTVLTALLAGLPPHVQVTSLIRGGGDDYLSKEARLFAATSRANFSVHHLAGTNAIIDGLKLRAKTSAKQPILVHVSADCCPDPSQPHRDVDLAVAQADTEGSIKTVTIVPPLVYGLGLGQFKTHSSQVPGLIRRTLKRRKAEYIGRGLGIWNHVHVQDLAQLFVLVVNKLMLDSNSVPSGTKGYLFAESGEISWKDLSQNVADAIGRVDAQLLDSSNAVPLNQQESEIQFPNPLGRAYHSSNSRSRAETPLLKDLEREVAVQLVYFRLD
ncbi:hypothetical protein BCR33DRAFT_711088 [Rhizoclosmatium globosum]|uniref:NAD-dependent epimerase/dehydratase domain-containing protein n=1 Tax=Rhizoclosmatium globosum TaxID=329046 RepID=A0A1Y2D369_9FUNG|nr:hypothetical protein BCR33DRAFT_711088 [Rhizoclosmatium globosum]|eukprot:ORY53729.1 hypothetical protein BCR33DRAFT_711088 [Rhizoclosmatium globosum]